jgi:phenylacetate-coenzyme A ligase PaaK-like adenylate-forming protein
MKRPNYAAWLDFAPYSMSASTKASELGAALAELTNWHQSQCPKYQRILNLTSQSQKMITGPEDVPYIPVRLFKEMELISVEQSHIFKTMTSSGTSGQQVSRIYLDRDTAAFQTKVLTSLMIDVLGKKRLPMLIIDSPTVLRDRKAFSARAAGILGFSLFGQNVTYALDEEMNLNLPTIEAFLERHGNQDIFLFGFTFMIWQYFCLALQSKKIQLPIERGILLHGGGWKKLQDQSITDEDFSRILAERAGILKVINYYGMVEQTGSIYLQCEHSKLHAPIFSDIVIRDPNDFHAMGIGELGLIETLSLIPLSYPGHALLTEDLGRIEGADDCLCGRLGKYFSVEGRLPKAEVRGCSNTYEKLT